MVADLGPVAESVFGLDLFRRQSKLTSQWRKDVRLRLGQRLANVSRLIHEHPPISDLMWLIEEPIGEGHIPWQMNPVRRQISATVFEFCQAAILPYWRQARSRLEAQRDIRATIAIDKGVESLLMSLHPAASWRPPVLEVAGEADRDVYLDGRGLLLCPALFLDDRTCVLIESKRDLGQPVLAFPVRFPSIDDRVAASDIEILDDRALGALVGHTRAAALQALADSCTTGELSDRLGISLAGASKHATVLREAGLVTTARHRNTALHTLTPLGIALLRKLHHGPRSSVPVARVGRGQEAGHVA
jgi:DNA-binding transcriptional ArsR family regulator